MKEIYYIANKLKKKYVKSFKQLGNQVKALTKLIYIENVLPFIQNYYITDKTDGLHSFLLISNFNIRYLTSEKIMHIQIKNIFTTEYIFDSELLNDTLYIFDVIVYDGINISNLPFKKRYESLCDFRDILLKNNITCIIVKQYVKLTIANYQKNIITMLKEKKIYNVDGLIFIEINANYNNTINLKWKPLENLTIDFLAVKTNILNQYILAVGIKSMLLNAFNLNISNDFNALVKTLPFTTDGAYVPVPFYNSVIPNVYMYTHNNNTNLHGQIIELALSNNKWIFHKIRTDRTIELQTGSYYGNYYKIAEQTLASLLNPLSVKELIAPYSLLVKNIYFTKQDNSYTHVKSFNNYVKNLLITQHKNTTFTLDLASGRGGDINKYINNNVKNVLMLEIDANAIEELITRKYTVLDNNTNKSCNFVVLQIDLNENYKKNILKIKSNFVNNNYVNADNVMLKKTTAIFCHFAMHYFLQSEKHAENIISFISHYLESNGLFIITIFDGQRVFDLLKKNNGMWKIDKKYMIKYKGIQPDIFAGFNHKIDVLLPLSNVPYEEPLIDLYALDKIFKKNNIYRIQEKNFDLMLPEYINNKNIILSDEDTIFIGLYKYVIYKRN